MKVSEFAKKVQADIAVRLGECYHVYIKEVMKNNGVVLQGLVIMDRNRNVIPTIYLEAFWEEYEQGKAWEKVIGRIMAVYRNAIPRETIDMEFYHDFQEVRHRIAYKLINAEKNKELLSQIPHVDFLDLAICFYYAFSHEAIGDGSIQINYAQMDRWKVKTQELFLLAQQNTRRLFGIEWIPMEKLLARLLSEDVGWEYMDAPGAEARGDLSAQNVSMTILSNKRRTFGAVCMLYPGALAEHAEKEQANLYILPSSVHEVILLPDNGSQDIELLREMVKEVNATHVLPQEILSDHVYYYDREKREVIYF